MSFLPTTAAMTEAARLTREGRLQEASSLLQRALNGGAAAPPDSRIIDVDPKTGAVLPPAAAGTELPQMLRGLLRQPGGRRPRRAPAEAPLPDGARWLTERFAGAGGSLGYRLYIPARRPAEAPALLVMLHGCTQSPEDFAAGTRMNEHAEAQGLLVAYPAQTASANAQRCWNWFNPADQQRDSGEAALIAGLTRQVLQRHGADPRRVYVAGLSAGGAQAAIMGAAYPELYAAIGVHSGLACGAARDMPSAFAAMRQGGPEVAAGRQRILPTIVFHADRDGTVHPVNGEQVIAQAGAAGLHSAAERGEVPGGHAWTRTLHRDAAGRVLLERWEVHGGGHAWSGGSPAGSYTDARGPDASREMLRFFAGHRGG